MIISFIPFYSNNHEYGPSESFQDYRIQLLDKYPRIQYFDLTFGLSDLEECLGNILSIRIIQESQESEMTQKMRSFGILLKYILVT